MGTPNISLRTLHGQNEDESFFLVYIRLFESAVICLLKASKVVPMAYIILQDDCDVNLVDVLSLLTGGMDVWDGWPTKLCFSATVNRISIGR